MRFLSYFLLFAVAISAPSVIRAQYDDHVMHVSAVAVPSIITEATPLTIDTNNNNDNNDDQQQQATLAPGTLIAPSLVYNQDHHQEDNDSTIISSLTSPMLIAVDASPSSEEEGLEGQSLLIDYQNDDENTIELFTTINEELQENGAESLLESMDTEDMMIASATAMPIEGDDDDDSSIDAQQYDNNNNNNDDDDHSSFDIAAAEGEASGDGISKSEAESNLEKEMKSKRRRPLRRAFLRRGVKGMKKAMRRFSPWRMTGRRGLRGKRLEKMLKLAVLSKKLKALDMKMDLMKLLTRAIQMRLLDRSMRGGLGLMRGDRATLMLQSLRNKMMKKLMVLKMIKLMHLLYQSTLGRPVYHRSGMRLSPRFLLRHLLRHAYRHPALAKLLMGLRLKSTIVRSLMKSFVNNLKFLLRKVYLLKKREGGNRHRLYVKADRAIVNVGDGNEFKPVFYRSRAAPRISVDDSAIPVRVTLPSPGIIRRVFERRTGQERRSD